VGGTPASDEGKPMEREQMPHFDVFYMKKDYLRNGLMGVEFCRKQNCLPNPRALGETHAYVKMLEANDLDDVWQKMQAEHWSPNGEACALIKKLDLTHTSMCVGDVIVSDDGTVAMVDSFGFQRLEGELPDFVKVDIESNMQVQLNLDRFNDRYGATFLLRTQTRFGIVYEDDFENEFYIALSHGQGGQTAWSITHTAVDMSMYIRQGVCKTDNARLKRELDLAFADLTKNWLGEFLTAAH
jgi:hypothetical protein